MRKTASSLRFDKTHHKGAKLSRFSQHSDLNAGRNKLLVECHIIRPANAAISLFLLPSPVARIADRPDTATKTAVCSSGTRTCAYTAVRTYICASKTIPTTLGVGPRIAAFHHPATPCCRINAPFQLLGAPQSMGQAGRQAPKGPREKQTATNVERVARNHIYNIFSEGMQQVPTAVTRCQVRVTA